ncbi:DUF1266 domain-containing protein [Marinitenerispora sediminis]|uniref:DUF1266 domain-containing protein n=1 Tax=Marinitenerispora sediminis TaxID=1931232 RepID=A0A368TA38_9ACTN|nr:DUF1266 domain-containing protein [Marinitenerispora sediminis]RCV51678.1 hypothetical protein DEF28_15020 [Marinitenerispora sediminis]RCV59476.1 hypothetical protein DEF23_07360 [Marinitenerispora sediminis]RCV61713.1 hypothetical protein DEF24_03760 [Marinitenerispora sediminis]
MFTAVAGVLGGLAIVAWAVVSWASKRRQPWFCTPVAGLIVLLVACGQAGWALLPIAALSAAAFAELVIGAREAPTLRTKFPDAPLSTERWAAAVAAPFRVALAEPWDVVTRPQLRRRYRKVFELEWGIVDRASLLATVDRLWDELHSGEDADLLVDLRTGTARSRDRGGGPDRTVTLSAEQIERMREITGADRTTETVVIGAYQWWASVHLVRLACGAATLDWLSPVEAQSLLRRIATDLQRRYASWQQWAEAFHAGYLLWRGGGAADAGPDRVWTALGLLTSDPASPWGLLPWDMPLERVTHEHGVPHAQSH